MALRTIEIKPHDLYEIRDAGSLAFTMSRDDTGDWVLKSPDGKEVMRDAYRMDIINAIGAEY